MKTALRFGLAAALSMTAPSLAQDGLGGTLPPAPPPAADAVDPVGDAFAKLTYAEVEDDLGDGDAPITAIVTKTCVSQLRAEKRSWSLDWRKIEMVEPGDTFVFVAGPEVKLGIVGDASKPDQAQALSELYMAMRAMVGRCGGNFKEINLLGAE